MALGRVNWEDLSGGHGGDGPGDGEWAGLVRLAIPGNFFRWGLKSGELLEKHCTWDGRVQGFFKGFLSWSRGRWTKVMAAGAVKFCVGYRP